MIRVNIYEAKARLSWCLEQVAAGVDVVICKHNRPIAVLRAIREQPKPVRSLGHAKGRFEVPATFFDPLPDEEIEAFYEGSLEPTRQAAAGRAPVAVETGRAYYTRRRKRGRGHGRGR